MNTSSGFRAMVGKKKKSKSGNTQKLPAALSARMKASRQAQQEVPAVGLSSYGRRRKMKMRNT